MKNTVQNNLLTIFLEGEINAQNVPRLQNEIDELIAENTDKKVIFDAEALTYISSAGLRACLASSHAHLHAPCPFSLR